MSSVIVKAQRDGRLVIKMDGMSEKQERDARNDAAYKQWKSRRAYEKAHAHKPRTPLRRQIARQQKSFKMP